MNITIRTEGSGVLSDQHNLPDIGDAELFGGDRRPQGVTDDLA